MKLIFGFLLFLSLQAAASEVRCGWLSNPSPNNVWLDDSGGDWLIATQGAGGYNAEGDWSSMIRKGQKYWVVAPGAPADGYGYGCACLTVDTDNSSEQFLVKKIYHAVARPLAACRADDNLRKSEPKF